MAMQKITYTGTLQNGPQMVDGVTFPRRYEATSGITIDGISNQITKNNTLNMPSDIIIVHIGTNDMYMSNPDGAPMRLGNLLDKLIAGMPNALIVVAKIIPFTNATQYNAMIRASSSRGSRRANTSSSWTATPASRQAEWMPSTRTCPGTTGWATSSTNRSPRSSRSRPARARGRHPGSWWRADATFDWRD